MGEIIIMGLNGGAKVLPMTATKQDIVGAMLAKHKWYSESDQELINRHRDGNVRGIEGATYWGKMEELHNYLKKRNLI